MREDVLIDEVLDPRGKSFTDTTGRVSVDISDVQRGRTAILLIFGQSNAANAGAVPYAPQQRVFNFNIFDGRCYVAQDPLLGPTERQGSFAARLGDLLIERDIYDSVVLVPIAAGGSAIEEWTPHGRYHRRLKAAIEGTIGTGLTITHVLWHQGETDAKYYSDNGHYRDCFDEIHRALRSFGVGAPVYIAQATFAEGRANDTIRAAQRALIDPARGIFGGPDTDAIGTDDRFDGCHMTESGLIRHAVMWFDCLAAGAARTETRTAQHHDNAAISSS